jgi:hypothetical protein
MIATVVVIVVVSVTIAMVNVPSVQQRMLPKVLPKVITVIVITEITEMAIVIKATKMVQSLSVKQTQLQSLLQQKLPLAAKLHRVLMAKSVVVVVAIVVVVVVAEMSALKVMHLMHLQYQQVHLQVLQ